MGRHEKLFMRIRNNPRDVRFREICALAEAFGFRRRGSKGTHTVYSMKGVPEIVNFQSVNGIAKPYQVRQLLRIIENYNLIMKER